MSLETKWKLLQQRDDLSDEGDNVEHGALLLDHIKSERLSRCTTIATRLLLALSMAVNIYCFLLFTDRDLDAICTRRSMLHWSPIIEKKITYSDVRFNGSLFHGSPYRDAPGPAVDKLWSDLGLDVRNQVIPATQAEKAGLTLDQVKRSDLQGGGFFVGSEAIHHLHCLNVLRQSVYFNFEYYQSKEEGVWANTEPVIQMHIGHCVDILRQQLMCRPDLTLYGQMWVRPSDPVAFTDFSTHHKCINWDVIRDWAIANQAGEDDLAEYHDGDLMIDKYP